MSTSEISEAAMTTVERFLAAVCGDHDRGRVWAEGAVLDAVVPGWRFTLTGPGAIGEQFRAWFRDPGQLEEVARLPTAHGEVVELTVTWTEDGVPFAARQVHVLAFAEDGSIDHDHMWCGGRWPAALLAEMATASDAG